MMKLQMVKFVIVSEARQSSSTVTLDCRVALLLAMTGGGQ